jgi:NAD(P)-dependent dehydrogenase (short-subunit alcohol dehydrogenase family)
MSHLPSRPSIVITGAAAGIGRAVAERFARAGWFVGLYDVDEAAVQDLCQQLGAQNCHVGRLDVSRAEDWAPQLEAFWQAAGQRLDLLFNNAGVAALYGQPMLSTYSASKAAVRSLTEALDIEWQRHGIRVVDVLPLFVNTAMVRDDVSKMKTVQTLGVRLSADDVARTVWRLSQGKPSRLPVHSPVGWQTHLFYLLAKHSPDAINRFVTARMAGH